MIPAMGYLNIANYDGDDFFKAVISLWFRIPSDSIAACVATGMTQQLSQIIPLVTFGRKVTQETYNFEFRQYATQVSSYFISVDQEGTVNVPIGTFYPADTGPAYLDPSYIGLQCNSDGTLNLLVNLQTAVRAALTGFLFVPGGAELHPSDPSFLQPSSATDVGFADTGVPEAYLINLSVNPTTFPDTWHHLLVSCDLSNNISTGPSGVMSFNKLWIALDDVNYNGATAFPNWPGSGDPNSTITNVTFIAVNSTPVDQTLTLSDIPVPAPADSAIPAPGTPIGGRVSSVDFGNYTAMAFLPASPIPVSGGPMGLPASSQWVNNVYNCEMAEFQMFTGVSIDTSIEDNRRLFLIPDPNGKGGLIPADPPGTQTDTYVIGSETDLSVEDLVTYLEATATSTTDFTGTVASSFFKQAPAVAFVHTNDNWIAGINSGTVNSANPQGTIKPYFPNPEVQG